MGRADGPSPPMGPDMLPWQILKNTISGYFKSITLKVIVNEKFSQVKFCIALSQKTHETDTGYYRKSFFYPSHGENKFWE